MIEHECNFRQQEEEDKVLRTARRERAKADAEWMKKVGYEPSCIFRTNVTYVPVRKKIRAWYSEILSPLKNIGNGFTNTISYMVH